MPTGTVTFLLTDVVSSGEQWQAFPDAMPVALAAHEQILRRTLTERNGHEFGTAGDSFAVAYASPVDAIEAAAAAQRALDAHPWDAVRIDVRMGLHSGQAEERDGRYFGVPVNQAARIAAVAGSRQIFVSEATCALARRQLGASLELRDIGLHDLKSFDRPERLFQVTDDALPNLTAIPSSRKIDRLPTPLTRFIGRSDDIEHLSELLVPGALLTISGLGGLGKTRLSIEVARRAAHRFPDGIWWVDLSPLADGSSIAAHAGAALEITSPDHLTADVGLADGLRRLTSLVVFDNCEHVIDEAATLIATLGERCPDLAILTTSRAPLTVSGERVWPIDSLFAATDGVALLIDRATAYAPDLDAARWPADDLVELCHRLDGMPLAIEMAAARLRALSPREILEKLEDRFRLLRSRDRHAAARHQTLLALLDWSYELLAPDEQVLLDRLSIFPATFDLESAQRVCADDHLDEFDVLDMLTALLDRSLISVVSDTGSGSSRYRLLETVRDYCSHHLGPDERGALRRALVAHAVQIVEISDDGWFGERAADFHQAFTRYEVEWDTFRDAVRWAVEFDDSESCGALLRGLWMFGFETFRTEIGDWGRSALTMRRPPLSAAGVASVTTTNRREAIEVLEVALADIDERTPDYAACQCYGVLHMLALARNGSDAAHYAERSTFHAGAVGSLRTATHRAEQATMLADRDPEQAARHAAFANGQLDRTDNPWWAGCLPPLAMYEARCGRPEVGHRMCLRAVEMASGAGLRWTEAEALTRRAQIALRYSVGEPRRDLAEAVRIGRASRSWFTVWMALADSVPWLHAHGFVELADTVAGYMGQRGIPFRAVDGMEPDERWRGPGAAMRKDELVDYVLDQLVD